MKTTPEAARRRAGIVQRFHVWDIVAWRSQAGGHRKGKIGTVVAVVPPWTEPELTLELCGIEKRIGGSPGYPRPRASYVVRVKGRLYWPRDSVLKSVFADDRYGVGTR